MGACPRPGPVLCTRGVAPRVERAPRDVVGGEMAPAQTRTESEG